MTRTPCPSSLRAARGVVLAVLAATTLLIGTDAARASADPGGSTRLVVGYRASTTPAEIRALDRSLGAVERSAIGALHARVLTVPSDRAAAMLAGLRADATVAYAEIDGTELPTDVSPNDPYFPTGAGALSGGEWGSVKTQAPTAWGTTTGSSSVVVAVIDSGVVASQSDLSPVLVPGWNVLTGTADTADTYGHGTEVAGVAVAGSNNGQGVAAYCWQCRLMPIKVYNSSGAYSSDIASGITWAVDHGARVLNISMAGTTASNVLSSAVSYANAHGAVVVAAAGNNGNSTPTYPASIPGVISVAATDQTDTPYSYSDYGSWVDVAAPGSTVTTLPNGAYGAVGGTSIASPAVAGIAGLLLSSVPSATPADVANALFTTTDPVAGSKPIAYGRVNAARAVAALTGSGSTTTPPPPPPTPTPTPTTTTTYGGSLTRTVTKRSYTVTAGAGTTTGTLTFGKCSAFSLSLATSSGSVLAQGSGATGLTVSATVPAGTHVWTVSSSCKVSYTLTVTAASS